MTEDRRLREKLAKLAADADWVEGGKRRLSPSTGGDLLAAMLTEIDETILGRRITFETDDGKQLIAEVVNRRLLRLVSVPADLSGAPGLLDPLGQDSDDVLPAVVEAMRRFTKGQGSILVATAPLDGASEPDILGRSVDALSRVAGTDPDTADLEPADSLASALSGIALAIRRFGPSAPAPSGPQAARLAALDEAALGRILQQIGPKGGRSGRFILLSASADALFVGCETEETAIAALVPATRTGETITLWRAASKSTG